MPLQQELNEEQGTLVAPQQRQKWTSKGVPGRTHTGVLNGKNIGNLFIC